MVLKDLSEVKNIDGKTIKDSLIVKSSNLHNLSKKDKKKISKHNVTTVVDLRTETERWEKPDDTIDGIERVEMPLFDEEVYSISHDNIHDKVLLVKNSPDSNELYRDLVYSDSFIERVSSVIKLIMKHDNGAILFHCSAGKDRTGFIAMIILFILGYDKQVILDDYLYQKKHTDRLGRLYAFYIFLFTRSRKLAKRAKAFATVERKYMEIALDAIDERFKDMENFINNVLGISNDDREEFKSRVLLTQE